MEPEASPATPVEERNPWTTLRQKPIYDNPWINVEEHDVLTPHGNPGIYGKVHFKNLAIGIVPLDDDLNTWLVGQYRYPLKQYSWEIPEGGGNLALPPQESAARELLEETGITARHWQLIQQMHLSNSVSDEHAFLFLAQGLSFGEAEPEETEVLQLRKLPFAEAFQMVLDGHITDSLSVAALLKVQYMLSTGEIASLLKK